MRSPGEMGADIAVGEGQSIGNALNFGGPYVGLFATRAKFVRQMPGRLAGETVDAEGRRGFVLTLSTREQHIRREKATSNICTNSGLCALAFSIHLTLLGEAGPAPPRDASTTPTPSISPSGSAPIRRRRGAQRRTSSTNSRSARRGRPRNSSRLWRSAASSPACRSRGSRRRRARRSAWSSRARRLNNDADRAAYAPTACATACDKAAREPAMNVQGRPTRPETAAAPARETFTGNRGLNMEEALIFESGRLDATGVDIEEPAPFASNSARTRAPARLACPASPSRRRSAIMCACRATIIRSTPGSIRSARAR